MLLIFIPSFLKLFNSPVKISRSNVPITPLSPACGLSPQIAVKALCKAFDLTVDEVAEVKGDLPNF